MRQQEEGQQAQQLVAEAGQQQEFEQAPEEVAVQEETQQKTNPDVVEDAQ